VAKSHRDIMTKLDPVAVARFQITEKDLRIIERYVRIIQAKQFFQIGTLLNSDLGVMIVEDDKLADAERILAELKGDVT
jgi:hypothetical protein